MIWDGRCAGASSAPARACASRATHRHDHGRGGREGEDRLAVGAEAGRLANRRNKPTMHTHVPPIKALRLTAARPPSPTARADAPRSRNARGARPPPRRSPRRPPPTRLHVSTERPQERARGGGGVVGAVHGQIGEQRDPSTMNLVLKARFRRRARERRRHVGQRAGVRVDGPQQEAVLGGCEANGSRLSGAGASTQDGVGGPAAAAAAAASAASSTPSHSCCWRPEKRCGWMSSLSTSRRVVCAAG